MVDVNMQEVVRLLNEKGYSTTSCCESHYDGNHNMYIAFTMNFDVGHPDGFVYAKGKSGVLYSFGKKDLETKEKYETLKTEKLKVLLEWARSLPQR